jgi:uncharacterized protein
VPVVVNSGPLIVLAKLNHLHLLVRLFGRFTVPQAVYDEVVVAGKRLGHRDAALVDDFLTREGCRLVPAFGEATGADQKLAHPGVGQQTEQLSGLHRLGPGESEALALALREGAVVVIDDSRARRVARDLGLSTVGTVGVLVSARAQGLLSPDALEELLVTIEKRDDIWIEPELCRRVRQQLAGDVPPSRQRSEASDDLE